METVLVRHALIGSIVLHVALIAVAVELSTGPRAAPPEREPIDVVNLPRSAQDPPAERPAELAAALAKVPALGFQILVAPLEIPVSIPTIDVAHPATDAADFSGIGRVGGFAAGVAGGLLVGADALLGEPFDGNTVDEQAYILPGQMGAAYPQALRVDAPDGTVTVRFVVDTAGRLEPTTFDVVRTTHPLFTEAVRTALARLRFSPATAGGRRVRVRMEQRFEFHLASR